jgi:drug/metabolite transporter (DMT)-like permease
VMLTPHFNTTTPASDMRVLGAVCGVVGAICAAFATIETRKLTQTESTGAIVSFFMLLTTIIGLATVVFGWIDSSLAWKWPPINDAVLLVTMGIAGGIGQITLTQSFRHAEASVIAPFDYISMIWAIAVGWFLFGELPQNVVVVGATIVVAAGIFVIWREHQLGLDRSRQKESGPGRAI